jgi:50S ribosomal protein L16 3-hydroxylase
MKSGLSALIHPHTIEEFFASYELNEPFVVHDNTEHTKVISDLPFLESLEKLLTSWPSLIQAHLPDVRDESSSIDTNTKDAQKLFNNGMGLLFNEAQTISPLLVEWLEEIKKNLGLSAMTYARCLIYATPDGKGTAAHFDQNINFVYQVHGTKVWHMAPNTDLENPLTRHTMGTMPDPEMMGYLEAPLPTKMPANVETYELKPGSILFVPRGYWHSTEAEGDALALNFTFTAPTWLDLFTAALRSRLAMSPDWRETANGVSDPDFRHLAEKKFDLLLGSLVEDLPHWRAGDILDAIEPQEEPN